MRRQAVVALVVASTLGATGCQLRAGASASPTQTTVTAKRADLVVSVRGLGKIVEARAAGLVAVPTGSASGASASASPGAQAGGGGAQFPADAVLPRASGLVARLLVEPGVRVDVGTPLAVLNDSGSAAAAVRRAQSDLATALLELRQRRTTDPLKGLPPAPRELAAGELAVVSAREALARLRGPARQADVSTARLDLRKAEAELETLRGGTRAARARALELARQNVQLAQQRLDKILAPPSPADVSAAEADVKKAEAELADLQRADPPASAEALAAARKAVDAARLKLAKVMEPASASDVTAARLELARAQADLATLEAGPTPKSLRAAEQAVTAARARLVQLLGPPLQMDVTAARLAVRKAEADLAVLRARGGPSSTIDIELAQLKVDAADAGLDLARFGAGLLTVRAPWSGTVTGVLSFPGASVDPTTPLSTVADLDHLAVSVDLSEFDAAQVKRGLTAVVSVDALGGKRVAGTVLYEALTGVDNAGVVTFPVRIALARITGVKPGMNASVRIIVARRRNVVQVPLEAVVRDEGQPTVTVVTPSGKTVSRPVSLGLTNNKDVEIRRGVRAGERVVLPAAGGE